MTDTKENKKEDKVVEPEMKKTASAVVDAVKDVLKEDASPEKTPEKTAEKKTGFVQKGRPAQSGQFRQNNRGGQQGRGGNRGGNNRGRRGGNKRFERAKPEFDQKIINIRRVTRVMAGGRRFSFSVAVVAGNRNGKVGVGLGKASDTSLAIEKAFKSAKKNMVVIKRNKSLSIPHEVSARYCTSEVFIKPAKGKGIVAGSSARNILDLAGITDVSSKVLSRSKNKINIARATILALREFTE